MFANWDDLMSDESRKCLNSTSTADSEPKNKCIESKLGNYWPTRLPTKRTDMRALREVAQKNK